ncbi:MAG: class I SAM-dependent methyltransferase [Bacteroidia bacterium]|nr:MAG: class I SAM-dependent methyltransferase [Bacteroidia bacterium]
MVENYNALVENQYHTPGLFEDILERLNQQELDVNKVSRANISGVDEFHVRGAEVSLELAREAELENLKVLDVGCGIGGPARMLADQFNCRVTGIDLSQEYIRTAQGLSELVGLHSKTEFLQGSALDLPFKKGSFDVVWTQHVQMNISDKGRFYSEINRVLADRGMLLYYDIFRKNSSEVNYPVPWADNSSISFLGTIKNMDHILGELGFLKIHTTDQTSKAMQFLADLFEKLKMNGPPKLGLNVLMGKSTREKLGNILKGIEEEKIVLQSGIYKKQ